MTQHFSIQQLRQMAATLAQLRGGQVRDAVMRSDLRQLRLEFADGGVVLIAVTADELGQTRLEVDVIRQPLPQGPQLEVRFDPA